MKHYYVPRYQQTVRAVIQELAAEARASGPPVYDSDNPGRLPVGAYIAVLRRMGFVRQEAVAMGFEAARRISRRLGLDGEEF
jgi:hypothetical protein